MVDDLQRSPPPVDQDVCIYSTTSVDARAYVKIEPQISMLELITRGRNWRRKEEPSDRCLAFIGRYLLSE